MGWHLESASLAAAFGGLPVGVKTGVKLLVAWPFMFHLFNGVKHFYNDMGKGYNKTVMFRNGWYLWGASLLSAAGLAFFY
jgi:succinate dehydrogenase (ubiquinone) cytochrome b560 subunit